MLTKVYNEPRIFQIDVPLPDNPLRNLNCYVVQDGGETLIIDTGFNRPECREALLEGLAELDANWEKTNLFLTHLHSDHTGLAPTLMEDKPGKIYISATDHRILWEHMKGARWQETDELFHREGFTREQLAELPRDGGLPVAFLWLGIALIIMPVATRMVVDNATVLANYFAISELTMGLTAIAIGTSLPELATAIAGVRKGENDIAVGNIISANIFNIVIVLGLPALITPGEIDPLAYSRDYSVMLLVSIIFALLCWRRSPQPGRGVGVLLTGGFIIWLAMLYWLSPILVE